MTTPNEATVSDEVLEFLAGLGLEESWWHLAGHSFSLRTIARELRALRARVAETEGALRALSMLETINANHGHHDAEMRAVIDAALGKKGPTNG